MKPDHPSGFSPRPTPLRKSYDRPAPQVTHQRRDPAPSRLAYRLHRMWLTPLFRKLTRVGLPAFLLALTVGLWLSDEDRRANLAGGLTGMVERVQNREEFMVHVMAIEGASPRLDRALQMMLPVDLPASSFDINLTELRSNMMMLDAISDVDLRIKPGGILSARVTERQPAILWRHAKGVSILDADGHRVASVQSRDQRPDLPLIAGEGGANATPEALTLIAASGPILPRLRGLQRMGERRWDVILDRGQRIMLPETESVAALERMIALDRAQDILGRDISVVDMRDSARPTVRMGLAAQNKIRVARGQTEIGPDGQPIENKQAMR